MCIRDRDWKSVRGWGRELAVRWVSSVSPKAKAKEFGRVLVSVVAWERKAAPSGPDLEIRVAHPFCVGVSFE